VVPRRKQFDEHLTDHQMDLAKTVHNRGWARMVLDVEELPDACAHPPKFPESYAPARHRLIQAVRDSVDRVAAMKALGIRIRLG
jgi:UDP-N-acetylglucosamine transferase subunit ALG13